MARYRRGFLVNGCQIDARVVRRVAFRSEFVPETKGTTLEELEDRFEAQGLERAAAVA
jgi:hypothetical protein